MTRVLEDKYEESLRFVRRVFKTSGKSRGSIVKRRRRIYVHVVMHRRDPQHQDRTDPRYLRTAHVNNGAHSIPEMIQFLGYFRIHLIRNGWKKKTRWL